MHSTHPLTRLVLVLALGLSGAAGAESEPDATAGPAAKPGGIEPAAAAAQASPQAPAEPDPARVEAWLAAGRALKAERPELFGGADGVLATLVLPDGQGAVAGIEPGDVLVAYGETPLGTKDQLIDLTGKTPPEQTLALRWLRPGAADSGARTAQVQGGRIGVGIRDLVETPQSRMGDLLDAGSAARNQGRYDEAMGIFQQGLALADESDDARLRAWFLRGIGVVLTDLSRYPEALDHHTQALAIARAIGDRAGEGVDLANLGNVYRGLGRYPEALDHNTQALAIHRAIGDRAGEGTVLHNLANLYELLGRYREAVEDYARALAIRRAIGDRAGEGVVLNNLGITYHSLGRYPEALELHVQALAVARAIGDRVVEGRTLGNLGNVYLALARYPEAVEHYTLALAIKREIGDREGEGNSLTALGIVYRGLGRYPDALEHHTQALAIYRAIGSRASEGIVLGNLAAVYEVLGRYPEALEHDTQALAIARAIGARGSEGTILGGLGTLYEGVGRFPEALEHHTQALAIFRAIGDRAGEGKVLLNLASVYQRLGRYPEVLDHCTHALAIARAIGDRESEGVSLGGLGTFYAHVGRYPEALEHHTQALAINHAIGNRRGEAVNLRSLSVVYWGLGRYPEALEELTQALVIHRAIGDRAGEGAVLGNLANVYKGLGRYPEALEHHTQALAIYRAIGDRASEGAELGNLAMLYPYLGRYPEAIEHLTQSLTIARETGNRTTESKDLFNLGILHAIQGRTREALDHYRQALALRAEFDAPEALWRLWFSFRLLWEAQSRPAAAIVAGKRAVNTIQAMRAILAAPVGDTSLTREQQQSFMQDKEVAYRWLADLLIAQDRHAEAQQVLDMLKEQELYDYIKEEGAHDPRQTRAGYNAMETEWNEAYDALAAGAPPLAQRLAELTQIKPEVRTDAEQAEIARLTAERDQLDAKLQRQLAALPERLAAIEPARQAAENTRFGKAPDAKPAVLAALSQRSGSRTGLLQFILLPNKVRILLTTPDGWETAVVEVPAKTLATEIETLRSALTDPTQDAQPPAKALYGRLVAPLAEKIDAAKLESLLVHLDGRLRYVPFAALHDGHHWLAERWPIVYYTAASERQGGREDERKAGRTAPDWRVAGLGTTKAHPPAFTALPTVKAEIDGIVRTGKSDRTGVLPGAVFLDAAFTETVLRTQAADSANRILHIASHFDLRPGRDTESSLLLGTGKRLSLRDLREREPRLELRHLDLVTLSACNTAMGGADASGAEVEGMGAIIQRQGARGVLASLWPVADRSTGTLMQTFYRLRAERPAQTKAQALRLAQLDLLRGTLDGAPPPQGCATARSGGRPGPDPSPDPSENRGERSPLDLGRKGEPRPALDRACRWSHPYYWAPFILMGNWL